MKTKLTIGAYLGMIVAGNLAAARFGPWATPVVGFFAIGFNLTTRDLLHQQWQEQKRLHQKMPLLVCGGSALTLAVNHSAIRIAVASSTAFLGEMLMATLIYCLLWKQPRLLKMNTANFFGGLADSILFPTIPFGRWMPAVMLAQWACKFGGGFIWSVLLTWKNKKTLDRPPLP